MFSVPDDTSSIDEERLPEGAPCFLCPRCQCTLQYLETRAPIDREHATDVSDYYSCPAGCGTYEHERSTHRFRSVTADSAD